VPIAAPRWVPQQDALCIALEWRPAVSVAVQEGTRRDRTESYTVSETGGPE
jgi:hypothetical protein